MPPRINREGIVALTVVPDEERTLVRILKTMGGGKSYSISSVSIIHCIPLVLNASVLKLNGAGA